MNVDWLADLVFVIVTPLVSIIHVILMIMIYRRLK